jgi:hypothetical protein
MPVPVWKIVNPKEINDSDVRMTDISVRSALMRVRWSDMPVRREDSSTEMSSDFDRCVICSVTTFPLRAYTRQPGEPAEESLRRL